MESNSLATIKIHANHLERIVGSKLSLESLSFADLQKYVDTRSQEDGRRGRKVSLAIYHNIREFNARVLVAAISQKSV
jgi:hypothetical protein